MGRTRRNVLANLSQPDLAILVANLQGQLLEQQQEMTRLREQLMRMDQALQQAPQVPPAMPQEPNVVPNVLPNVHPEAQPEAQPEVPRNAEIPMAPVRVQVNPPVVREDLLYERVRRMKAPEFEGPTDPVAADNWLINIQVISDSRRLTEQKKAGAKQTQPRQRLESHQKGQANKSAQNAGKNKRKGNSSGQGQRRDFPQKKNKQGKEDTNTNYPVCASCGRKHPGVCKKGSTACYRCGEEGHYARNCSLNNQNQNPPYPDQNNNSHQLHAVQARQEELTIMQGILEAPEPHARIYAYTNGDAKAETSHAATK